MSYGNGSNGTRAGKADHGSSVDNREGVVASRALGMTATWPNGRRTSSCHLAHLHQALCARGTGRPNRWSRIGTTIMFSAVELNRPNMITIAIGA